jgi:tetratricopeptide (TPR) repeat protein
VESLPTARLLLLVNYRPEYQHGWGSKTYYHQLQIDPLPPESADVLLHGLLGDNASLEPLRSLLILRTGGNPFFLEESVRMLVETGVLVGQRESYYVASELPSIQVPPTVQAVLAARIDRLPVEEKRLLQTAAVIGKDVPLSLLLAVADESDERVRSSLDHLRAAEFLYERSLFPEVEYTFKHALTAEVAYASVLTDRRRSLHARVAHAMAPIYGARLEEHAERLAYHSQQGELWEEATRYGRLAGMRAESRLAFREAVRHYKDALAALTRLPESRARIEEAVDLRFLLRTPVWQLGGFDEVLAIQREAERMARELGDAGRLRRGAMYMYNLFWIVGDHEERQGLLPQVQAAAAAPDDPPVQLLASLQLGQTCLSTGDIGSAQNMLEACLPIADGAVTSQAPGGGLRRVQLRAVLALAHAYLGEFREGIARGAEAMAIADSLGTPSGHAYIAMLLASLHAWRGDFAIALSLSDHGRRLAEAHGLVPLLPPLIATHGLACCGVGRVLDGIPLLERGIEVAESRRVMYWHTNLLAMLAEGYLLAGDVDRSGQTAARALDLARTRREPGFEAWSHCLLGAAASGERLEPETAERSYRAALTLAEPLRLRPLVARCHLGLGQLFRRTGKRQQAEEHLSTASAMFREMDMTFWLTQAEAEMRGLA